MTGRLLLILAAVASLQTGADTRSQDAGPLGPDLSLPRPLARGEEHRYRLPLGAGELASVTVAQLGLDVIVETRGPDDAVIAVFQDDLTKRGREQVDVVAEAAGVYTLVITRAPGSLAPGTYTARLSSRRPAAEADRALQQSRALRTAAARLDADARLDEARPLLERALAIAEGVRPADDDYVVGLVCDLAANALEARDNARAQTLYQRAFTALEHNKGPGDPATAIVQSRLAMLYQRAGERAKAEALLRQAIDVIETTLGDDHLWFVRSLITLANLRNEANDVERAEEIDRRALAILEQVGEHESLMYAGLLNNLGDLARQKAEYDRADELLRRALAMGERLRGADNYYISTTLQNLGIVARERKEYAAAEAYQLRALGLRERFLGPDHPDVAQILVNLANLYRATGDPARSIATQSRALRIWEATAGPYERGTLLAVGNIARTYASMGDLGNAIAFQRRTDALIETQLALNLAVGSEREKMAFARAMQERTDRTISLHLDLAPANAEAGALAALVVLQRKGRVLDAMADTFAAVRQRVADGEDRALLDELNATTNRLARLALTMPVTTARPEERRQSIRDLEARKERLESELSAHSAEFRARVQPVTLDAVQAAIPADAALVEFAVFRPFDPKAERNAEAYGAPHYAAYVLRRHGAPRGYDLGAVQPIDHAIARLRQALCDPERTDVVARARDAYDRVLGPLRASILDATRLLISPDGLLNLIPFEVLADDQGRYLVGRYRMSYLSSGRDLLRLRVARDSRSAPVIVADPFFGEPPGGPGVPLSPPRHGGPAGRGALPPQYFTPLAGAAAEARAIKALFPDATLVTGAGATKAALLRLDGPKILHIASHGFFHEEAARDLAGNPLLWSGIALAGANITAARGDGLLTALEASGLNLWGTRLVTLSGCETGLGEVRNGEGVYGLRRAFVLAGTETLVMSLWPVSDGAAREMMTVYYNGLRRGLGRGDALRQAKLALQRRPGREHPFYWASFIQSGEWAALDHLR